MTSTFDGFSEEDVERIKSGNCGSTTGTQFDITNVKKLDKIGIKQKKLMSPYKLQLKTDQNDDAIDNMLFEKCKLSLKTPTDNFNNNVEGELEDEEFVEDDVLDNEIDNVKETLNDNISFNEIDIPDKTPEPVEDRKISFDIPPESLSVIRSGNYTENELAAHKAKLADLQLRQKLMEEQNKKRKEMLSKALADRTKQTEEEVLKLDKIKRELQVLDGQLSQDVSVLRKKIDQACLSYSEAEKTYLKVEKEFLQAKINLQKAKEKKELLTEHLCALITHNETRKAKKLETLMMQLAFDLNDVIATDSDPVNDEHEMRNNCDRTTANDDHRTKVEGDEQPIIVDGVDEKTGKIVELNSS